MDDNKILFEALRNIWKDIKKINAMMGAYEAAYLNFEVSPEELSRQDDAEYMFYAIRDAVKKMTDNLEEFV